MPATAYCTVFSLIGIATDSYLTRPSSSSCCSSSSSSTQVGGIQSVTLGDEEAKRRGVQKSILERAAPPTFDVAVEMEERGRWRVHLDVAAAVDSLLAGAWRHWGVWGEEVVSVIPYEKSKGNR